MNAPTEPGSRKLAVARQTAIYLFIGLIGTLVASGYFKMETATCVQAYLIYAGALVGKDSAFMWGNSREHAAKAKPEEKPNA